MKPFCFVLMPFGKKLDSSGREIDFDIVYADIFKPAIEEAGLEPIRADEEMVGGIIHKPMFERLMLCEYAIADLTTANPNVLYELGVRHGVRPYSTVIVFGSGTRLPFDVQPIRGIPYEIDQNGALINSINAKDAIKDRLISCKEPKDDSPIYQLITSWPRPDVAHIKTDVFRDVVRYNQAIKSELANARGNGVDAVSGVEAKIDLLHIDPAIVLDLLLSYRAVSAWQKMVELIDKIPVEIARSVMVQEQLGLALNRLKDRKKAERVLTTLISTYGPSSETNGILGGVYKDLWMESEASASPATDGFLEKAIETYLEGFEADWRDPYPGINAVTLMEFTRPTDKRQAAILPVVKYAIETRLKQRRPDYWDLVSLMEVHVIGGDVSGANRALSRALAEPSESWQRETTARNLALIANERKQRGIEASWIDAIISALSSAA